MSIAVNKIANRMKNDFGYHSIEFDFSFECNSFVNLIDKTISVLTIAQNSGKYEIRGSKSTTNKYAVRYIRTGHYHLLLRIPSTQRITVVNPSNIIFKLSDVHALGELYHMKSTGPTDFIQRVRKAVKRAFRMKSSPIEHVNVNTASELKKLLKIQRTPQKKSSERIMKVVDLDVAITPKKRNRTESPPARVPLSKVKSASRYHSLRAPPRIDAPSEAPLAEAQPQVPLAEAPQVPLAEVPLEIPPRVSPKVPLEIPPKVPLEILPDKETIPAERKHSRSNRAVEPHVTPPKAEETKSRISNGANDDVLNILTSSAHTKLEINAISPAAEPIATERNVVGKRLRFPKKLVKHKIAKSTTKHNILEREQSLRNEYTKIFQSDIETCINKPDFIDMSNIRTSNSKTINVMAKRYIAEFVNNISHYHGNINEISNKTIRKLYTIWFTCFFNLNIFFARIGVQIYQYSDQSKCILIKNEQPDERTTLTKFELTDRFFTIIQQRVHEYTREYVPMPLRDIILADVSKLKFYLTDNFISNISNLNVSQIDHLFDIWYSCYFDMFEYFKVLCKENKTLTNIIRTLPILRDCSKRFGDVRAQSVPVVLNTSEYIENAKIIKEFNEKKKTELRNELSSLKPTRDKKLNIVPLSDINRIYDTEFTTDYALCLVVLAHLSSLESKKPYSITSILRIWHDYVRLTKNVFAETKEKSQAIRVLTLWKTIKSTVTIYQKNEKHYSLKQGLVYKAFSQNFLYDLITQGTLDCAGGTSMLYALVKSVDETIDIRTVQSKRHTLIAIGEDILLETTESTPRLLSTQEYQKIFNNCVWVNPKVYPTGLFDACVKLLQIYRPSNHEYNNLFQKFELHKSAQVQIQLYTKMIELKDPSMTFEDWTISVNKCLFVLYKILALMEIDVIFTEKQCLSNVSLSECLIVLFEIDKLVHRYRERINDAAVPSWRILKAKIKKLNDYIEDKIKSHQHQFHNSNRKLPHENVICFDHPCH